MTTRSEERRNYNILEYICSGLGKKFLFTEWSNVPDFNYTVRPDGEEKVPLSINTQRHYRMLSLMERREGDTTGKKQRGCPEG
jgi:hypothetical protein